MLGDLLEWAIGEDWSRRWVMLRAAAVFVLAVFFKAQFIAIFDWFVQWKAHRLLGDLNQLLPTLLTPK
jgi:hypothetical protein